MKDSVNPGSVLELIDKHDGQRGSIIAILEDIQASYNYLPKDALEIVAKRTGHSLVDLYGIATFYTSFSLEPRGKHLVSVCMGTACHVRGAPDILEGFETTLEVKPGQTTGDRSFTLTTVNCLGACALGPVSVMDGEYCRNVKKSRVPMLVRSCLEANLNNSNGDPEETIHLNALCPHCNRSLMTSDHKLDGHSMIHVTASFGRKHGGMRLSSIWGDHRIQSEHEIPAGALIDFFCPRCHAELRAPKLCSRCDAPTIPLLNKQGGIITLCSRRGCTEHMFDLT
jgi:NADH:ubiquinone oxidoreductase subunit E